MKTHSVKSNAKRAARKLCEQFSGIEPAEPAPGANGEWLPAVRVSPGCLASAVAPEVAEQAVIVKTEQAIMAMAEALPPPVESTREEILARREERRQRREAKAMAEAPKVSKRDEALNLMRRPEGATAEELQTKLGWLAHTLRGFVSTQKSKHGIDITKVKADKVTTWRIAS